MLRLTSLALVSALAAGALLSPVAAHAKDRGPASATCDQFEKSSTAWLNCAELTPAAAGPAQADAQHFYAGYWLAKNGRYAEALDHLRNTQVKNARVLTYIGFATRKLGHLDEAMGYYAEALRKDPENVIARSYLGEAYLAQNDLDAATAQLHKVEAGCGVNCDAYTELAAHIAEYRSQARDRG